MRLSRTDGLLVLAFWALACFHVLSHRWGTDADYWEWEATLREAARDPLHPGHPILKAEGKLSSRFTPVVVAAGGICRATGLDARRWLDLQGCVVGLLFPLGVLAFCRRRWKEPDQGRYTLLALLFLWGLGWQWSGETAWITLSQTWTYPVTLALTLMLWTAVAAMRWLEGEGGRFAVLAWLGLLATVTTHPETGAFASLLLLLLCVEPWRPERILPVLGWAVATWALAFAWPYYSLHGVMFHGVQPGWIERNSNFYNWHLMNAGPALLGIPVAFRFARDRREPFLVAGIVTLSLVYAAASLQHGELGRIFFYLLFFLHLAAARQLRTWGILDPSVLAGRFRCGQVFHVSIAVLALWAFAAAWHLQKATAPLLRNAQESRVQDRYAFLSGKLGSQDVVAVEPRTGWPLPALTGARTVALYHRHPLVLDQIRREEDVQAFLSVETRPERRAGLAGQYGITRVLLREGVDPPPSLFGEELARAGELILVSWDGARGRPRP